VNRYSGEGTHEVGMYLSFVMGDLEYEIRRPARMMLLRVDSWAVMVILALIGAAIPCTNQPLQGVQALISKLAFRVILMLSCSCWFAHVDHQHHGPRLSTLLNTWWCAHALSFQILCEEGFCLVQPKMSHGYCPRNIYCK